jgi:hypothetical protein
MTSSETFLQLAMVSTTTMGIKTSNGEHHMAFFNIEHTKCVIGKMRQQLHVECLCYQILDLKKSLV